MPFPLYLALRYLKSTRRDAFASFLSAVAAGGIALGVAALILSLAALSGFQGILKGEVLARSPHLEIELPTGTGSEAVAATLAAVRATDEVHRAQLTVRGQGWVVAADGLTRAVEIHGVSGEMPASFPGAEGKPEGMYVDDSLAESWGLRPGDTVQVVSPHPTLVPFGPPQPRVRSLPLTGTFLRSRTQEDKVRVAVPLAVADSLFPSLPRRIEIVTAGLERTDAVAGRLARRLPEGSQVRTWRDLHRSLFFVLRLEKALMFVAVSLIVLVASLALVADLALVVSSKRAEIGMLGAMGAPAATIRRTFVLLGALLAALGTTLGLALGIGGAWVLDRYRLLSLPGDVYVFDYVPFTVRPVDLAVVLGLTLLLALAFSLYAAQRAASLAPLEALRR